MDGPQESIPSHLSDSVKPAATASSQPVRSRWPLTLVLIATWAIVVFIVQEYTTGSNYPLPIAKAVGSRCIRFSLNLLACGLAVSLLRRWFLQAAVIGCTVILSGLMIYYEYFGRTLTWTTIVNHSSEGMAVGGYVLHLLRWESFSLILLAAVLLATIVHRVNRRPLAGPQRIALAAICGIGYPLAAIAATQFIDKMHKLRTFASVDRLAMTNGYLLTWFGEWCYLSPETMLVRAMEAAKIRQDRLAPIESPLRLGDKVAIIQAESLDYAVIDLEVRGEAVMPFLRDLLQHSMRYRISAIHRSGSCDADFAMLMNLNPSGDLTPFTIPGMPWDASMAALAKRAGYQSVFLHGNDRSFFNRGPSVDGMGFDVVLFRENLESEHGLAAKHWGISDEDVMAVSRRMLNAPPQRAVHFIITLTTHGPYHFLDPKDYEMFPSPSNTREHYLNSMRYLDNQFRLYLSALPAGAVVIVYGDHSSHVQYGPGSFVRGEPEYVPFLIHQVGEDLAQKQLTREQEIALSGELTTLDAAGYVWSLLRNSASE